MSAKTLAAILVAAALAPGLAFGQADQVATGRAAFQRTCAPCHAAGPGDDGRPMLPGTQNLQWKYKGEKPALLEQRIDLPGPVLRTFVRRGSWSMPGFRKSEVTDAEIEAIAAYLAVAARTGEVSRRP
jgi:mono/diheme cytochrome c family protein